MSDIASTECLDFLVDYSAPDWDGDGAQPITPVTLEMARAVVRVLPRLADGDIAPGADGSIGFELKLDDRFGLWLDIGPANRITGHITENRK